MVSWSVLSTIFAWTDTLSNFFNKQQLKEGDSVFATTSFVLLWKHQTGVYFTVTISTSVLIDIKIQTSLIYATHKLNSVFKRVSRNSVEFRNFKKFNVESFLNDLYTLPWVELDNKQNVDEMWESWKALFIQVLDKHAPKR